jgi:hypothetical protein
MVDRRYYFPVFSEEDVMNDDDATTGDDVIGFYSYDESILRETGINAITDEEDEQ